MSHGEPAAGSERAPVGVALAGGRSSRLGADKTALRLTRAGHAQSLLAYTVRRLAVVCREVLVAAGDDLVEERRAQLEGELDDCRPRFVADAQPPALGPAAGLLAAAAARPGSWLLALACDLPRVPASLLARLMRERDEDPEAAWIAPVRAGRLEPLCALYSPAALRALARRAATGRCAVHELRMEPVRLRELVVDGLPELLAEPDAFLNVNSPEDLARFLELEARGHTR